MENLKKKLNQDKVFLADDLLRINGDIAISEKRIERNRKAASEIGGRIIQIEEILNFLKTNDTKGGKNDNIRKPEPSA